MIGMAGNRKVLSAAARPSAAARTARNATAPVHATTKQAEAPGPLDGVPEGRLQHFNMPSGFTVGVEFELVMPVAVQRSDVEHQLQQADLTGWRVKGDGSIRCNRSDSKCYTLEITSPVLSGVGDVRQVYKAMRALKSLNPTVNTSTGMHVHVGKALPYSLEELKAITCSFMILEQGMDKVVPGSRRANNNKYCKTLLHQGTSDKEMTEMLGRVKAVSDVSSLQQLVNPEGRRYKLNLHALDRHGTLEFRHPGGTQNGAKAVGYLLMYLAFVDLAIKKRSAHVGAPKVYDFEALLGYFTSQPLVVNWLRRRRMSFATKRSSHSSSSSPHNSDCGCSECQQQSRQAGQQTFTGLRNKKSA